MSAEISSQDLSGLDETFERDALPPAIRDLDQWVTWGNGTPQKCPTQPVAGTRKASTTQPETWGTFEEALEHFDPWGGRGLGFVLTDEDPYLAFDIDCPDYPDGSLPEWLPPLDTLGCGSWVYRTPSGKGWRVVLKVDSEASIPDWWTDLSDEYEGETREIALTCPGKYMTVTDDVLSSDHRVPRTVDSEDLDTWLREAHKRFTGDPPSVETNDPQTTGDSDNGSTRTTHGECEVTTYDVLSPSEYPEGIYAEHPFHGSDTGGNFKIDSDTDGETWRCWRHDVTGHGGHLLGMDVGVLSCEDAGRTVSREEWAKIYEAARQQGYDIPDPRTDDSTTQQQQVPATADEIPSGGTQGGGEGMMTDDSAVAGTCGGGAVDWDRYHDTVEREDVQAGHSVAVGLVLEEFDVRTDRDSGTLYVYDEETGVYSSYGEDRLREALMDDSRMGEAYNRGRAGEILHQVRTRTKVPTDSLGGSPSTVVVSNGTLEWEGSPSGVPRLRDHSPEDNALSALPVEYDSEAECPRWDDFVDAVIEDGMEETVQEYVGYCLMMNDIPFHKALMLVGDGANGKSQFLDVVKRLLGEENHTSHALQEVSTNSNARAQLRGSVANIHGDLSPVALGPDSMFKTLVGGDTVTAERKYESPFQFQPTAKHIYAANELPDVHTDGKAFFRRWLVVECPNTFRGEDRVPNLGEKIFQGEASGILNWALEGRERLLSQEGFSNDGTSDETRSQWRQQGDLVAQFIEEHLTPTGDEDDRVASSALHEEYRAYVEDQSIERTATGKQKLTEEVKKRYPRLDQGSYRFDGEKKRGFKGLKIA